MKWPKSEVLTTIESLCIYRFVLLYQPRRSCQFIELGATVSELAVVKHSPKLLELTLVHEHNSFADVSDPVTDALQIVSHPQKESAPADVPRVLNH